MERKLRSLCVIPESTSQGFTLIESLVSIVVVSVLIVGIAPMMALTVASRVQARRVDQATQAARAYVDGVRGGAIPIPKKFAKPLLVPPPPPAPQITATPIKDSDFPASVLTIGYPTDNTADTGIRIDTNNNGFSVNDPQDLIIMPVRNNGPLVTATDLDRLQKQGFEMIVRVYRADSFSGANPPTQVTATESIFTNTNGARNYPLVVVRAEVVPSQSTRLDLEGRICNPLLPTCVP